LNLHVLARSFGFVGGPDRIPNAIESASVPHVRRCLRAGLVEVDGAELALTDAGRRTLGRSKP